MAFGWLKERFGISAPKNPEGKEADGESGPEVRETPEEAVLRSREKSSSRKLLSGITQPSFVELKDDGQGVFKTEGQRNERAAYLIDRFLGLNLVPPTVMRRLDGKEGSLQKFVPGARCFHQLSPVEKDQALTNLKDQFMKMWVLDLVIQNTDRHGGNFLIKGGRLYAIDHGGSNLGAKRGYYLLAGYDRGFFGQKLPVDLIENFRKFLQWPQGQTVLRDLIEELIGKEETKLLLERIKNIGSLIVRNGFIPRPQE